MDYDAMQEDGVAFHDNLLHGLGATDAAAAVAAEPSFYDKYIAPLVGSAASLGTAAAQYQTAKIAAKTGQVPTVPVSVGVSPDTKKLLIYGGLALAGVFVLIQMTGKRGRR